MKLERLTRRWLRRALVASSCSSLVVLVASFTSCATNAEGDPIDDDAATSVPEAGTTSNVTDGGPVEAGCDASDPDCTSETVSCDKVSWCLVPTPATPTYALSGIWGASADDVWAVGSGGTIIHYDGKSWTATPSGFPNAFYGIWGSGPNDIWVVSTTEVLLHGRGFENGAAVWENVPVRGVPEQDFVNGFVTVEPNIRMVTAVWGSSANDVRIGTRGRLDMSAYQPDQQPDDGVFDELYFQGSTHYLVKGSSDGGLPWRPYPALVNIRTLWGSSATDVWMTSDRVGAYGRGTILHGTPYDGGLPHPNVAAAAAAGETCFGCDPGCVSCGALSDPLVWTPVDSQTKLALEAIWGSSASDVWAVGEGGTIRRFKTGDVRWAKVDSPSREALHGVWGSGPNDVWIVGDRGTILHYDGATIEPASVQLPLGPKPNLRGVWGSGPNDVWIVGDGVVLHFTGPKTPGQPK